MNQILDYNPNKSSGGGSSGSDKIVRIFAIILICFALCLVAVGGYGIYKNKISNEEPAQASTKAKITVEQGETTAVIKVSHDKAIEKLIYSWDSGKENNIKGNGEASMETEISLLAGTHKLIIKVIDIDGVESTYEKEFTSENGEDKIYPVISLEVTEDKKLKITATDETAIDYVTYRWNDEEEVRVDVSEDDDKKIEFEIEILKGQNDLLISAVDKNKNTTTEPKSFTGVTKPDVKITISADKKNAEIHCSHENGIKAVELNINGQDYNVTLPEGDNKDVTIGPIELIGDSTITVKAISIDDTETQVTENIKEDQPEETNDISITIEQNQENKEIAFAEIKSSSEIKEIKLNINDQNYDVTLAEGENKEVQLNELPLQEGNNKIIIKVITVDNKEKEEVKEITR